MAPTCPYCQQPAVCVDFHTEGYPYIRNYGPVWICLDCGAWVGCHRGTTTQLGRLANATLRRRKMEAHAAFDPLWKSGKMSRSEAYRWLREALGAETAVHIGEADVDVCRRIVELCKARMAQ